MTDRKPAPARRIVFIAALLLAVGLVAYFIHNRSEERAYGNSILVICPYRTGRTWVFDDERFGLVREPFVAGIPEMIDKLVADIPDADKGFRLLFSAKPFPGYAVKLEWRRSSGGGNWYYCEKYDAEGWLCPALFAYFKTAPRELYVKAEPK